MSDQKIDLDRIQEKIDEIERKSADSDYIFRGETKSSYKDHKGNDRTEVSSKLWRDYKFREENFDFDIEHVQKEMLAGAKKHRGRPAQSSDAFNAKTPDGFEILTDEDFEILTEIQHYGGKTNLIDFTTDYRIALFFACDGDYAEEGRVILQKIDSIENGKIETPWIPRHRVIAQKSVFVRPRKGYIDPKEKDIVKIPAGLKEPILKFLEKYHGIDKENIYNDLHGFIYTQDLHGEFYTRFYRGLAHRYEGKYGKAIEHYDAAIKLNPRSTEAYNNRGFANAKKGDFDTAIRDYDKAIELDPNDADIYDNRGLAYAENSDFDEAIKDYTKAINLDPKHAMAYNNRGVAYDGKGDFDNAIKDYTKAIGIDPKHAMAYTNRGVIFNKQDRLNKAMEDHTMAIKLQPDFAAAYNNRGLIYGKQDKFDMAIRDFTKAIELDRGLAKAYSNRAMARLIRKDWNNAKSDMTDAQNGGIDIAAQFQNIFGNIEGFKQIIGVSLPPDIAAMLTVDDSET